MAKTELITLEKAQSLALEALTFLAEDTQRLARFLGLTGMSPGDLRGAAGSSETLLAVLDHLMADESLLLVFAASRGKKPESFARTRALLARDVEKGNGA